MWLSRYEKHNVLSFIRRNSLRQFTTNELIMKITKAKRAFYGYGGNFSRACREDAVIFFLPGNCKLKT